MFQFLIIVLTYTYDPARFCNTQSSLCCLKCSASVPVLNCMQFRDATCNGTQIDSCGVSADVISTKCAYKIAQTVPDAQICCSTCPGICFNGDIKYCGQNKVLSNGKCESVDREKILANGIDSIACAQGFGNYPICRNYQAGIQSGVSWIFWVLVGVQLILIIIIIPQHIALANLRHKVRML